MAKNLARTGEQAFQKMDKINAEVFTLTYGAMVQQLLKVEPSLEPEQKVAHVVLRYEMRSSLPSLARGRYPAPLFTRVTLALTMIFSGPRGHQRSQRAA